MGSHLKRAASGFGALGLAVALLGTSAVGAETDEGAAAPRTSSSSLLMSCQTTTSSGSTTEVRSVDVTFTAPPSVTRGTSFDVAISIGLPVPSTTTFGGASVSEASPPALTSFQYIRATAGASAIGATQRVTARGADGSVARVRLNSVGYMSATLPGYPSYLCSPVGDATIGTVRIGSVVTNRPPDCSTVTASTSDLGAPNHKMRTVTVSGATDPDGDTVTHTITGVQQDEAVDGLGDGDTAPDAVLGTAPGTVDLRAERSGTGDGRVYVVSFTASDGKGGSCSGQVKVSVRHHAGQAAVDSGDRFDALASVA